MPNAKTVSELTHAIKHRLSTDFFDVCVTGEISTFKQAPSGHIYLTLKDERAKLDVVIWRTTAERLKFELKHGMQVVCNGGIDVYPQRGNYQFIAQSVEPIGQGALQLAFRQLLERLGAKGMFNDEHKKPLPKFPRRIAVVTSPSGAAVHDFSQVVLRRWPSAEIIVVPATVQGENSAYEIASGIQFCGGDMSPAPDVIVVTRGGGSIEDLWSFNEELVVRAIFACPIPVVSAVGHEVDVTLSDLVADVRALTPTEAGEKVVPDRNEILQRVESIQRRLRSALLDRVRNVSMEVDSLSQRIQQSLPQRLATARMKLMQQSSQLQLHAANHLPNVRMQLQQVASRRGFSRPLERIREYESELETLTARLQRSLNERLQQTKRQLTSASDKLDAISPLRVLGRGYSLTADLSGNPITDCQSLAVGDKIQTDLADGKIVSQIEKIEPKPSEE